ncbi:hypothetical protein [Plastoroseomonas hellenica]|uniref:hypothetical protein n=1 Tax=Plastoroseomonas hellenica TaxID=2687306 RepID=UPI001BAB127B|nr:hypothetical protein [Plastoroseomonas hellenica]
MTRSKHADSLLSRAARKNLAQGEAGELGRDPGINTSKGVFGRGTDPRVLQADSTDEGDILSDTTREGAVDPGQRGRTNK